MSARRLLALSLILNVLLIGVIGAREGRNVGRHIRALVKAGAVSNLAASPPKPPPGVIDVSVDTTHDVHAISPFIYGIAKRDPQSVNGLGAAVNRWGGNPSSRFNWVIGHAWNAADDWEFRNLNYGTPTGSVSDAFVQANKVESMASVITIPALGWVAKSDRNADYSTGVPADGGPATGADGQIQGYDPSLNRARTSVLSLPRKPAPFVLNPDPGSSVVYQDEWVNHLKTLFGSAATGGVRFFAIDNEPGLWSSTQRDVHPARVSYDEEARVFLNYSDAVKAVDPTAQVLGPEECCWTYYFYSELDRGSDNFATHADRNAHGGTALIPWFLRTVRQHDAQSGRRSLDVLTVHYYPQAKGVYSDTSNPALDALRLRSTRALWDPSYVDESWIHEPVALIPRLKSWIGAEYPGTKVGITEYNFGGGDSVSAALAEADVLGIFGREDVYLANYWTAPKPGSPAWLAFQMYRNYDGRGGSFGATSVHAASSDADVLSAFAATEPGWVDVMLVNKQLTSSQQLAVSLSGSHARGAIQRYQYSGADPSRIVRQADVAAGEGHLGLSVPAGSITLLRIPATG